MFQCRSVLRRKSRYSTLSLFSHLQAQRCKDIWIAGKRPLDVSLINWWSLPSPLDTKWPVRLIITPSEGYCSSSVSSQSLYNAAWGSLKKKFWGSWKLFLCILFLLLLNHEMRNKPNVSVNNTVDDWKREISYSLEAFKYSLTQSKAV